MRRPLHVSECERLAAGAAWRGKVSIKTTLTTVLRHTFVQTTHTATRISIAPKLKSYTYRDIRDVRSASV